MKDLGMMRRAGWLGWSGWPGWWIGAVVLGMVLPVYGQYGGGDGSAANPYQIWDPNQMNAIGANSGDWGKCFKLMANIDMSQFTGTQYKVIGISSTPFTGTFDGNGHIISKLTYSTTATASYVGLFGYINNATLQNLGLENVSLSSGGSSVGGLAGRNAGTINNCYATGSVSGSSYTGGLVGVNYGTIARCYVNGSASGTNYIGGLVGSNNSAISACYATGSVDGLDRVGGLVGYISSSPANVTNCYAAGSVSGTGSYVGGLVGEKVIFNGGYVNFSFWDMETSGLTVSAGGIGKTTAEMKTLSTFTTVGWDFIGENDGLGDWIMPENDYPQLGWEVYIQVTVPDLHGLTVDDAQAALIAAGLISGEPHYIYDTSLTLGLVSETLPGSGFAVYLGLTPVHLLLATDTLYSGGVGTSEDPYQISTLGDWITLMNRSLDWNKQFILMADIDMSCFSGIQYKPIGESYTKAFTGIFDGNGHVISNLTFTATTNRWYVGLFGYTQSATIKNLGVENVSFTTGGDYIGGIVGLNGGLLISCHTSGLVNGKADVGGLVGMNYGTISGCYAFNSVNGTGTTGSIGGLIGFNDGTINGCYATGSVKGTLGYVQGLVGLNSTSGIIKSSFWDVDTSGQMGSSGGKGLTTEQMKTMSIFQNAGWTDYGWTMEDGVDYPRLSWEEPEGERIPAAVIPYVGSGTAEEPYLISTAEEFALLSWYAGILDKEIRLTANLDVSRITLYPIGDLGPFTGVFDGGGFTISNVVIHQPENTYVGLFGYLSDGGQLCDLGIENIQITGCNYVGGLVALINSGTITSSHATGMVNGEDYVGGLVGMNYYGIVNGSYTAGSVTGLDDVGGLAGFNHDTITGCCTGMSVNGNHYVGGLLGYNDAIDSIITNCHSTGAVSGNGYVGGLIGYNNSENVTYCHATGAASGSGSVGGLVGWNESIGIITSCYASGAVNGTNSLGGLVGYNHQGSIIKSYATGSVSGNDNVGGLVGLNYNGSDIITCYATGPVRGRTSNVGGLVGWNNGIFVLSLWDKESTGMVEGVGNQDPDPYGVVGLDTAEMMTLKTKGIWDFTEGDGDPADWMMLREGEDYPRLAWQEVYGGDIAGRYGVDMEDLLEVAGNWLEEGCPAGCEGADINGDGAVDLRDFAILAGNWLKS